MHETLTQELSVVAVQLIEAARKARDGDREATSAHIAHAIALLRGIPPFLVGALFFTLRLPHHPETWVLFVASFYLAVVVSFALRFMVNLSAFWIIDVRGVTGVSASAWTLLSGFAIPIAFFPDTLRHLIRLLPFVAMLEMTIARSTLVIRPSASD